MLGAFIGEYVVHAVGRSTDGAPDSTTARSVIQSDLGGCLVVERYAGSRGGEPYDYLAIWGTGGEASHPIQRMFSHSQHGLIVLSEGDWNRTGDTLIIDDSALVRGRWIRQREMLSRPAKGVFTVEALRSEDGGASWITTKRAHYESTSNPS